MLQIYQECFVCNQHFKDLTLYENKCVLWHNLPALSTDKWMFTQRDAQFPSFGNIDLLFVQSCNSILRNIWLEGVFQVQDDSEDSVENTQKKLELIIQLLKFTKLCFQLGLTDYEINKVFLI